MLIYWLIQWHVYSSVNFHISELTDYNDYTMTIPWVC